MTEIAHSPTTRTRARRSHVENKIAPITPVLVIGFWDKNTGIRAGAMPYRHNFPATTGIYIFQA